MIWFKFPKNQQFILFIKFKPILLQYYVEENESHIELFNLKKKLKLLL